MLRRCLLLVGVISFVFAAMGCATAAVTYTITDLGAIGGTGGSNAKPLAINDSGQVVGTMSSNSHAFLWQDGAATDLGTLGGSASTAFCLNNNGWIAGNSTGSDGNSHVFAYHDGSMHDLGTMFFPSHPGGLTAVGGAVAYGMNNNNVLVAAYTETYTITPANSNSIIDSNGNELAYIGRGSGTVYDIDDNGVAVGAASGTAKAWMYSGGVLTYLPVLNSGNVRGYAYGSSSNGTYIAGSNIAAGSSAYHAVLWTGGATVSDLGTLGGTTGVAYDVNNAGVVVGASMYTGGGSNYHAFIYTGGTMTDLYSETVVPGITAAGWTNLFRATGINASGKIVGYGTFGGVNHGFLLTPTPEPSTLLLLSSGLVGLLAYAWRKRK